MTLSGSVLDVLIVTTVASENIQPPSDLICGTTRHLSREFSQASLEEERKRDELRPA